mmetsp:Transcript_5740/g.14588  ORF Transcript_5740/g.14588 Transcript_5740/m.14588 type:complete len:239 (-) Transcript_5740:307-1023(-)|eukprot:CAMPEP_0177649746 /NCGR_PEP_ID=MMETSP0447-20121125/11559_1 /TAXON_ID=0 /ORGANISM="Stygamoeba regulata, Strain BSH-02190019" /LENGTH=238 /DNA_ID=CAMNT_0019152541 /DNA_START=286 /DNA_END=1002 /DNA_ORIENTATION=+
MSSEPDLITQVSRDDEYAADQPSFLQRFLCCCCVAGSTSAGVEMRDKSIKPGEFLLGPPLPEDKEKQCLVLDLDETLVHSSFKPISNADFIIPVEIEDQVHQVYVVKRPFVDEYLKFCGEHFEVVVFTASLAKYADPVLDLLDKHKVVRARLFREACTNHKGSYVKDLGRLGRDLKRTIIVDNSPVSYQWHRRNAMAIISWFDDETDVELREMQPFLEDLTKVEDVRDVLTQSAYHAN